MICFGTNKDPVRLAGTDFVLGVIAWDGYFSIGLSAHLRQFLRGGTVRIAWAHRVYSSRLAPFSGTSFTTGRSLRCAFVTLAFYPNLETDIIADTRPDFHDNTSQKRHSP